jgi:hypothetical protein
MKITLVRAFLVIAGMACMPRMAGQIRCAGSDSIPIIKPDIDVNLYRFMDNGETFLQISPLHSEFVYYKANPVMWDIGDHILTALTGIGFNSTSETNWKVSGILSGNDVLPDWIVSLFCEGYVEHDRERVRNDDGSTSVETSETNVYYWDKDATGIIVEGKDTVGYFLIVMDPRENELLKPWSDSIWPPQESPKKSGSKVKAEVFWRPSPGIDYGITGIFNNRNFLMIHNGTDRKVWFIMDNAYAGMFQTDINFRGISKKYRVSPYFLINRDIPFPDRRDLFRLAMMSKLLHRSLNL